MKVLAHSTKRSNIFVIFTKTKILKKLLLFLPLILTYNKSLKIVLYIYLEKVLHTVDSQRKLVFLLLEGNFIIPHFIIFFL